MQIMQQQLEKVKK